MSASGLKVQRITAMDADGNLNDPVKFRQDGPTIHFDTVVKFSPVAFRWLGKSRSIVSREAGS